MPFYYLSDVTVLSSWGVSASNSYAYHPEMLKEPIERWKIRKDKV